MSIVTMSKKQCQETKSLIVDKECKQGPKSFLQLIPKDIWIGITPYLTLREITVLINTCQSFKFCSLSSHSSKENQIAFKQRPYLDFSRIFDPQAFDMLARFRAVEKAQISFLLRTSVLGQFCEMNGNSLQSLSLTIKHLKIKKRVIHQLLDIVSYCSKLENLCIVFEQVYYEKDKTTTFDHPIKPARTSKDVHEFKNINTLSLSFPRTSVTKNEKNASNILGHFLLGCPALTRLNVSGSIPNHDNVLCRLGDHCPHLKELDLSLLDEMSNGTHFIQISGQGLNKLKLLHIGRVLVDWTWNVSESSSADDYKKFVPPIGTLLIDPEGFGFGIYDELDGHEGVPDTLAMIGTRHMLKGVKYCHITFSETLPEAGPEILFRQMYGLESIYWDTCFDLEFMTAPFWQYCTSSSFWLPGSLKILEMRSHDLPMQDIFIENLHTFRYHYPAVKIRFLISCSPSLNCEFCQ